MTRPALRLARWFLARWCHFLEFVDSHHHRAADWLLWLEERLADLDREAAP